MPIRSDKPADHTTPRRPGVSTALPGRISPTKRGGRRIDLTRAGLMPRNKTVSRGFAQSGRKLHVFRAYPFFALWNKGERTAPPSQTPLQFVTITHPFHPLRGHRLELVRIERGDDPCLTLRRNDGLCLRIAMSATDFAAEVDDRSPPSTLPRLDPEGLHLLRRRVDQLRERAASTGER